MRDKNLKIMLAYVGLLGGTTFLGTFQPQLPRRYSSESTAPRGEFASLSWTDGTIWGHVHVRIGEAVPKGHAHLYYQILRGEERELLAQGRGFIRKGELMWDGSNGLRLKTDTSKNPHLKRRGQGGLIDLHWESMEAASDAAKAHVEGAVFDFGLAEVTTAFVDQPGLGLQSKPTQN